VTFLRRLRDAWRALPAEHRLCGVAALVLLATMLLPWYERSRGIRVGSRVELVRDHQSALQAFSFVEAAVLLIALGVLALLFARGERRAFHLPGGDGTVITGAGAWAALLIVWRFFDKPGLGGGISVGLAWGIFFALAAAVGLALAGNRLRAARRPEPPLERVRPTAAKDEPIEFRIPEDRPHLEETHVMGERRSSGSSPLSREAATQDTAEFRAAEPAPDAPTEKLPPEDQSSNSA
jgi:hypothetical protein